MRDIPLIIAVVVLTATSAASGQTLPGDAGEGRAIARRTCAACHSVEKGAPASKLLPGPAFQDIADLHSTTAMSLRVFLRTPHRNMPNLQLKQSESDDLIAYILSLK